MVGGEFEFSIHNTIKEGIKSSFEGYYYSSGRAALYHIISHAISKKHYKQILLPDYLCDSIIDIVNLFKIPIKYYTVNIDLTIDIDKIEDIYKERSIILFINYFGVVNNSCYYEFIKHKNKGVCLIEDDVQAFYIMNNKTTADYSFTSFRKSFAVPDGGWVKTKHKGLKKPEAKNHFVQYKIAASVLKNNREKFSEIQDAFYLSLFKHGEKLINSDLFASMSSITTNKIQTIDFESIKKKRKENATFLIKELENLEILPIVNCNKGVPLFIPIRLKNRDKIRRVMFSKEIFCPVHWPVRSNDNKNLKRGVELSSCELSLIVDQRYNTEQLFDIVEIIKDNMDV